MTASECLHKIESIKKDCSEANWDGYGATPISEKASAAAIEFVLSLGYTFPIPDPAPEPDGCISLEWYEYKDKLLSVSFGGAGIPFAWINGSHKGSGVAQDGNTILAEVRKAIGL